MALAFSTLRKPDNRQFVDPSTGRSREEWDLYLDGLTKRVNAASAMLMAVSVLDFGAKGDGVTNDSTAFQAALDAVSASTVAKRVFVPHRDAGYVFGATVSIPEGVVIFGENRKGLELSKIKPAPAFTAALFRTADYGVTRKLRIGIEGLFLDGSSTTLSAIQANCQESHFRDLTIKNCFTYGLQIGGVGSGATQQALNNHLEDLYLAGIIGVTEFFDGIFLDYNTADTTLTNCYIEACKDAGIRSRGYNNKITNNHIFSVAGTGGGVGAGIYTETSADHDISQNYIELTAAEGVLMAGGGADVATLTATLCANVFRNIDTGNTSNGVIEIANADVSSVTVVGNVVRRDAATAYSTPHFVYFNGITPTLQVVLGNSWQSGLITTSESNLANTQSLTIGASFTPFANDGAALGSATLSWADAFLASGGVINWANGDVTITHSSNQLAFAGATSGYSFDNLVTITGQSPFDITYSDNGAGEGPRIDTIRVSTSPAASDILGVLGFSGNDSGGNTTTYAKLFAKIIDPTDGSEDGELISTVPIAGSLIDVHKVGNGVQIGSPTGGYQGVGTLNLDNDLYKDGTKVVGAQGAAVADATGAGDVVAQLNALLARLRAHGLIAT